MLNVRYVFHSFSLFLLIAGFSASAHAWEWRQLWSNENQLAHQSFARKDYQEASILFQDIAWRAAANYRQGDYEAALTDLNLLDDIDSLYNRGNAMAQLYRLNEAIDLYRRVLTMDPQHVAAAANLELVAALKARLTDDPGTEEEMEREEGEESEPLNPEDAEEITAATNGQENEQNQEDNSQRISEQESQVADGNTGNSHLDDPESAEEQEFSAALEQELSLQQWLGRIKDDPGTLMKNKFEIQRRASNIDRIDLLAVESNQQLW